jgi:protein required for attachment to host cells
MSISSTAHAPDDASSRGGTVKRARTWILIADGGGARILEQFESGQGFQQHSVASGRHMSTTDAVAETAPPHHALMERRSAAKALEALFASQLSSMLTAYYRKNAFDRLILIAPSTMLQRLRTMITPEVREKVIVEIEQDLSHVPNEEIPSYLNSVASI